MKIAITTKEDSMKSELDERFGRCSYFAIHNSTTNETEFFKNSNKESPEGAGPASAQFVASHGVEKIVSGDFGGKVKKILEDLQIQMVMLKDKPNTIQEIITLMNNN